MLLVALGFRVGTTHLAPGFTNCVCSLVIWDLVEM